MIPLRGLFYRGGQTETPVLFCYCCTCHLQKWQKGERWGLGLGKREEKRGNVSWHERRERVVHLNNLKGRGVFKMLMVRHDSLTASAKPLFLHTSQNSCFSLSSSEEKGKLRSLGPDHLLFVRKSKIGPSPEHLQTPPQARSYQRKSKKPNGFSSWL